MEHALKRESDAACLALLGHIKNRADNVRMSLFSDVQKERP